MNIRAFTEINYAVADIFAHFACSCVQQTSTGSSCATSRAIIDERCSHVDPINPQTYTPGSASFNPRAFISPIVIKWLLLFPPPPPWRPALPWPSAAPTPPARSAPFASRLSSRRVSRHSLPRSSVQARSRWLSIHRPVATLYIFRFHPISMSLIVAFSSRTISAAWNVLRADFASAAIRSVGASFFSTYLIGRCLICFADAFSGAKLAAAGIAAGLMLHTGVAEAGVQLAQPDVKKVRGQLVNHQNSFPLPCDSFKQ